MRFHLRWLVTVVLTMVCSLGYAQNDGSPDKPGGLGI